ncbi:type IV pilus modification protein PilV [Ottowia testudinis]|uniref:Type IV pilus modification protein PilV n=2 Tax=Ottowia testudinis TaxID=2816950 RepID=A0A975H5H2_9BURK|nr:type IV pilus modification protein PilV [Ottowia testudinis]
MKSNMSLTKPEQGIALLEALVALIVVALGLLGILGLQTRTLADTQTGVRQAQAIRLIENLSERIRLNPNSVSQEVADSYITDWGDATESNCDAGCTPADLAKFDVSSWKTTVKNTLPLSDAKVFYVNDENGVAAGNRRQVGVMISWRENERNQAGTSSADQSSYLKYFHLKSKDAGGGAVSCPSDRSCHLQFIQLATRCVANRSGGASDIRFFCADGGILKLPAAP